MSWHVEEVLRGFSRLILRSCPYSASPVATGHPEELHDEEQFRVLASAILFVRISDFFFLVSLHVPYTSSFYIYLYIYLYINIYPFVLPLMNLLSFTVLINFVFLPTLPCLSI